MKALLFILTVIFSLLAFSYITLAQSVMHEQAAFQLITIAAILFVGAALKE